MKTINSNVLLLFLCIISSSLCMGQVNIVSTSFSSFLATPESMLEIGLVNSGESSAIVLEAKLYNSSNQVLIHVKTLGFKIESGFQMLSVSNIGLSVREYGITKQADYIRANQVLPSGTYSVCYSVFDVYGEGLSSNCFDISSEINSNLILVSPFNNEIVETAFPVLSWFHSEPFDVLDEGEYYRMIVCEILEDESPGSAIADENPVFVKENLYDHQVPYPIDAISLKEGSRYAWEVQKVNRNNIIQRTDPWVFQLKSHENQKDIKYAVLSKQVDGGYYTVRNNRLYFRFDDYYSGEKLNCTIYDKTNKPVSVSPSNEKFGKEGKGMLEHGYNRFIIELEKYGLGKGIFLLEVRNSKNELFKLKFKLD